jgi:hypothetical protein
VTSEVIDAAGGCIDVCGEILLSSATKTPGNADSALEAICVSPRGDQQLQLVRQMTSMQLNCVVSGVSSDCSGNAGLSGLLDDCTKACLGDPTATRSIGDCIGEIDCFNNGGAVDPTTGLCGASPSGNCEQRNLPSPFDTPGADTPQTCNQARGNACTVVPPGEFACSAGTRQQAPETCP